MKFFIITISFSFLFNSSLFAQNTYHLESAEYSYNTNTGLAEKTNINESTNCRFVLSSGQVTCQENIDNNNNVTRSFPINDTVQSSLISVSPEGQVNTLTLRDCYGLPLLTEKQNVSLHLGFAGQTHEEKSTKWVNFNARGYEASTASFNQLDPQYGRFLFQTPYSYSNQDPINVTDPNGEAGVSSPPGFWDSLFSGNSNSPNRQVGISKILKYDPKEVKGVKKALRGADVTDDSFIGSILRRMRRGRISRHELNMLLNPLFLKGHGYDRAFAQNGRLIIDAAKYHETYKYAKNGTIWSKILSPGKEISEYAISSQRIGHSRDGKAVFWTKTKFDSVTNFAHLRNDTPALANDLNSFVREVLQKNNLDSWAIVFRGRLPEILQEAFASQHSFTTKGKSVLRFTRENLGLDP